MNNERRDSCFSDWLWVPDNELEASLQIMDKDADFYFVRHTMLGSELVIPRTFPSYETMLKKLKVDGLGGDFISIYPMYYEGAGAVGYIPDKAGLVPLDIWDEAEDNEP